MTSSLSARKILTPAGWVENGVIRWNERGIITEVSQRGFDPASAMGTVLPGMANVHTHSFQRAMAGLAESRGPDGSDDFWTWRKVMYRFLEILTPDQIEAIAALVQVEMAEAGYTASAEFHYLHHQPGGARYDDMAETAHRIMAASRQSGIGMTLLPVLYTYGGLDQRELSAGQLRFGCRVAEFERLYSGILAKTPDMPADFTLGVAPHSLRAVSGEGIAGCLSLCPDGPVHIHAAEQVKEVEEVEGHLGSRPVRWLLDNCEIGTRWCLIHATHLDDGEVSDLAASRAVAGLCPTTEANLGDGIFPAVPYLSQQGRIGIGSDSNIRLSLTEELRMLEVSQRLLHRRRAILTDEVRRSNGRNLYELAAAGGAQAIGRDAGVIAPDRLADVIALRDDLPFLDWRDADQRIDSWIFGVEQQAVSDVWSAGRHIVRNGQHVGGEAIRRRFHDTMRALRQSL